MIYKMSEHASQERIERMMYLVMEIGLGDEVCSVESRNDCTEVLTSTGLILVLGNENLLVTAYIANMDRATRIWRAANGNIEMPQTLYRQIVRNKTKYEKVQEINNQFGYHQVRKKDYKFYKKRLDKLVEA